MPFRRFNGTTDKIDLSIGVADVKESARTFVAIVRMRNNGAYGALITQHKEGVTAQADFERDSSNGLVFAIAGSESSEIGFSFKEEDGWCLVAASVGAAAAKPVFYKVTLPGKVLTEAEGGLALGPVPNASTITRLGAWQTTDFLKADYAAAAIWKKALTKAEIEALAASASIKAWLALASPPNALWMFNQAVVTEEVKDQTAGGANQSARTGTEVIAEEPPIAYAPSAEAAPTNLTAPVLSGTPKVGETLSITNGTWEGAPTGFTYQWLRINNSTGNEVTPTGATNSNNYTPQSDAVGQKIVCEVRAKNAAGESGNARSNVVGPVEAGSAKILPVTSPGLRAVRGLITR